VWEKEGTRRVYQFKKKKKTRQRQVSSHVAGNEKEARNHLKLGKLKKNNQKKKNLMPKTKKPKREK